jgi:predicted transcriptional regulator
MTSEIVARDEREQRIVGLALRELRERTDTTQKELAVRSGFADSYISRVEHGRLGVRWSTVMRLMRALDADLHQLADALAKVEQQQDPSPKH